MSRTTIVLTLIMKNEEDVITKCIESALPFVDEVVIVDTGSTDQSIERARLACGTVPITIQEMPWKGFAESRNDALRLAAEHGDYALMIDADCRLVADRGFTRDGLLEQLTEPAHRVSIVHGSTRYSRPQLTHRDSGARFRGVVHEFVTFPSGEISIPLTQGIRIENNALGTSFRNKNPRKYFDDAIALKRALEENPDGLESRYVFYLAQSYLHGGMVNLALESYERRLSLGGWSEELYISAMSIGQLKERLNRPANDVICAYLSAQEFVPTRAESLYHLARYARDKNKWNLAYMSATWGRSIPEPVDSLFMDTSVYSWRLRYELSISSWYVGKFSEGRSLCLELLESDFMNDAEVKATEGNLDLYVKRLESAATSS